MYYKIELSGCSERKGLVQVRYALYLDPGDHGYEKHHVNVPISKDSKIKQWVNNPFHNHFCQFEPTVTDEEIKYVGELALQLAKEKWDKDEEPHITNIPVSFPKVKNLSVCSARLSSLSEVK